MVRTLLLDDNPDDRALAARELRRAFPQAEVIEVLDQESFSQVLGMPGCDLAITDYQLRWSNGLQVLQRIKEQWPECPVIMFTGTGSQEIAVEAMKAGLDDYVLKSPRHFARLRSAAKLALDMARQRQNLKQVEARYGDLFDSVPIGLYEAAPDGQILDANPALVEMLEYPSPAALRRVNVAELYVDPSDFNSWKQALETSGLVQHHQARLRTFAGGVCWTENSARAVLDPRSQQLTYEGSLEDITARKNAEEERERLIEELQAALSALKALSGLLPICASCKKIRDQEGDWKQLEVYIQAHSDAQFTHSFCPECLRRLYPEVFSELLRPNVSSG